MTNKLNQLFIQSTQELELAVQSQLLKKNKLRVRIKATSKTGKLVVVALVGAAIFAISFASWVVNSFS